MTKERRAAAIAAILLLSGCAATLTKPGDTQPHTVYRHSLTDVQKAAVTALEENGFEIRTANPDYVDGVRPHKPGMVGSGGETAGVWLTAQGAARTAVQVNTEMSLLGRYGQKNWDSEILAELDKSVGPHE